MNALDVRSATMARNYSKQCLSEYADTTNIDDGFTVVKSKKTRHFDDVPDSIDQNLLKPIDRPRQQRQSTASQVDNWRDKSLAPSHSSSGGGRRATDAAGSYDETIGSKLDYMGLDAKTNRTRFERLTSSVCPYHIKRTNKYIANTSYPMSVKITQLLNECQSRLENAEYSRDMPGTSTLIYNLAMVHTMYAMLGKKATDDSRYKEIYDYVM